MAKPTAKRAATKPAQRPASSFNSSLGQVAPPMSADMTWRSMGSSGLRQFSGWVREEFLPQLVGRQAARVYREMTDNDPTCGALLFAISQAQRSIEWRVSPPDDTPQCAEMVEFVESLMDDMSHSWSDFLSEAQTKFSYGFAPFEKCYKRRLGRKPRKGADGKPLPTSKFDDGKIGIWKLPLRGQDTVIKWFFDNDGVMQGMTQQPWVGPIIDIPAAKMFLLRPSTHKNNPEGRSLLRNAYRPWYFVKRLEEQEAICLERMSGTPEYRVPNALLEAANANDPNAIAALAMYKKIITNVRVDEQMGLVTPSDMWTNADGTPSAEPMYEFRYAMPQGGRAMAANFDTSINRYKLDIMTSVLADFLTLGHGQSSRGSQTLGEAKIDMFFQAQRGWAESDAGILNEDLLPSIWELNGFDPDLMPKFEPDMPQRIDLDGLSNFVFRLGQVGALRFGDDGTEDYLREAAGLPELSEEDAADLDNLGDPDDQQQAEQLQKRVAGMLAKRMTRQGQLGLGSWKGKRRGKSARR